MNKTWSFHIFKTKDQKLRKQSNKYTQKNITKIKSFNKKKTIQISVNA